MESLKLLPMFAEYGPIGIALIVVVAIWFKTSKDHQSTMKVMSDAHQQGMNRIAEAINVVHQEVAETAKATAEIKGIVTTKQQSIQSMLHRE